jgi:hypothetical protein
MRLSFGIILGILLTIGGAYVIDAVRPAGTDIKPMVNWDVVQEKCRGFASSVQDGWNRLTGHAA